MAGTSTRERAAQAQAPAPEPTPEPTLTPEPTAEPEPAAEPTPAAEPVARTSRREAAEATLARTTQTAKPLVLAQGCTWREVYGPQHGSTEPVLLGKCGITVESDAAGNSREYLTWVPRIGRVQKTPTFAVFPVMDAGDLD